ncbi:hypothetical protein ACFLVR_03995 [Chloroflexota bacterium]
MIKESKYNPLSWGTLFFSFWLTLYMNPNVDGGLRTTSYLFLFISILFMASILIKPISDILKKRAILALMPLLIFYMSIIGYTLSLLDFAISDLLSNLPFIIGLSWMCMYGIVFGAKRPIWGLALYTTISFLGLWRIFSSIVNHEPFNYGGLALFCWAVLILIVSGGLLRVDKDIPLLE